MLKVYSDFNCPFCFAQSQRIRQLALQQKIQWCFIEHAHNLNSTISSQSDLQNLSNEFDLVRQRAPEILVNKPEFCVNTRLAILSYISISLSHPQLCMNYLTAIYQAYWQLGKDISDKVVLRRILQGLGVDEFDFNSKAESIQNQWQQEWLKGGFDERIPVMSSAKDRLLLGLQHIDNIDNFVTNSKGLKVEAGVDCSFRQKRVIAVFSQRQEVCREILNTQAFELHYYSCLSELPNFCLGNRPDIILVDFAMDKQNNFNIMEFLKNTTDISFEETPFMYLLQADAAKQQQSMAYALGAVDTICETDCTTLTNIKLERRILDSRKFSQLSRNSIIDSLTGVYNRRQLESVLENYWRSSCRQKIPLSIIMVDIDYFKQYNDFYGHLEGDNCLILIAQILQNCVQRTSDIVARFGGEEFVVVLPDTPMQQAEDIALTMRAEIELADIKQPNRDAPKCVTASFGVGYLYPHPDYSPDQLLDLADKAMYRSKSRGRNCVTCEVMPQPKYLNLIIK